MNKFFAHWRTVNRHRRLVRKMCFKVGIPWQGIVHDLSKYSKEEFWVSVKHFDGTKSPNENERAEIGYSTAWLHHKGRNKHHFEYWFDYNKEKHMYTAVKMPIKYVKEMLCDRIAACKVYHGKAFKQSDALDYFLERKDYYLMHEETSALLESWLRLYASIGDAAFEEIAKVKDY